MGNLDNIKKMIARGDREGAVKMLVSILRLNCNDVDAWLLLGDVIEDPAKKRDCYNQALKISPNNLLALDGLRKLEISKIAPSANSKDKLQDMQSNPGHKVSPNTIAVLNSNSLDERVDVQSESITEQSTLVDGEIPLVCPRCGNINNSQSKICVQCYYTLALAGRKRNPNNNATVPPDSVTSQRGWTIRQKSIIAFLGLLLFCLLFAFFLLVKGNLQPVSQPIDISPTQDWRASPYYVSEAQFGNNWPFTVSEGLVRCVGEGIVLETSQGTYGLTGYTDTLGYTNIKDSGLWKSTSDGWGKVPLSTFTSYAVNLCR